MQALRYALAAFVIWLVPFIVSFPFFDRNGTLIANIIVFKVCMAIVLSSVTYIAARWYFGKHTPNGYGIALTTLAGFVIINVVIDQFTIMKMLNMSAPAYITQVVSLYSLIVIMGLLAAKGRVR